MVLLEWLYKFLHRRYGDEFMEWRTLYASVGSKMISLKIYGPEGMKTSDVKIQRIIDGGDEETGNVNWFRLD